MNVTVVCCILALVSPVLDAKALPEQDTDPEITSLQNEVTQLKQDLASLQTQSHTQDQKYAAILSSVLSSISLLKDRNNSTNMELVTVKNQLSSVVSTMETDHNSTVLELNNVKNQLNMSAADLNDLKSQLSTTGNRTFNESELSSIKAELGSLGVCFEVSLNEDNTTIKDKGKIIFGNVTLNIGQSYEVNSGVFSAPISGTYLFWAHILREGTESRFDAEIFSSKGRLTRGYALVTQSMHYNAATPIVVAFLTKRERVWFKVATGASSVTIIGKQSSSYGGTLLHVHNI